MKTNLSLKSFAVGLLAGGLLFTAFGATTTPQSGQLGRFQISAAGTGVAYVVDTATGQVWSNTINSGEFPLSKVK